MPIQAPLVNLGIIETFKSNKTVVFIDSGVEQPDVLAQGVIPGAEVHFLSAEEDALAQITMTLGDRTDLGAVHIISHGAPGRLLLGNSELNLHNLNDQASNLAAWFQASQANHPELLLYGCNVAAGDAGEEFITRLQALSGATIAAASHTVGAAAQGGQWRLNQGRASATLAITPETQATYTGAFPATIAAGDLAVVSYGSDNTNGADDQFGLVALTDIPAGSVIFITDQGFDSTTGSTRAGENIITWTVGSGGVAAGTVITNSNITNFGTAIGGPLNFTSTTGDQLLVYQSDDDTEDGSSSSGLTFIYAFNNSTVGADANGWQTTASDVFNSGVPTGLTTVTAEGDGNTAFGRLSHVDNAYYNGPTTGTKAQLLAAISTSSNWVTNDDDSQINFGDAPTGFGVNTGSNSPNFIVQASGDLATTETGGTDTFTVKLASEPTADVVLTFASSDTSEATVSGPLTFNTSNWFEPQTVTVTGVNDDFDSTDGFYDITASVTGDAAYAALTFPTLSGVTPNDDTAGFTVTNLSGDPMSLATSEAGGTVTFDLALATEPLADVTVTFTSDDVSEGTVTETVTFTSATWDTPQTIEIRGVDDAVADGNVVYGISSVVTSTDDNYNPSVNTNLVLPASVSVTNTDNDTPGITVSAISGNTTEANAGEATFGVTLTTEPTADVTLTFVSSDTTEGTVTSSLIFTAQNWDTAQSVTVTGVDDAVVDGNVAYSIDITSASTDSSYNELTIPSVAVTNVDDDVNTAPTIEAQSFSVAENSAGATVVGTVVASDAETPNDLAFSITEGNDAGFFAINPTTGQITLTSAANLDFESGTTSYQLGIQATETTGDTPLSKTAVVTLNVTDVAEASTPASIEWNTSTGVVSAFALDVPNLSASLTAIGRTIEDPAWRLQTTGDLNGDGQDDVLLRNFVGGFNLAWYMQPGGQGIASEASIGRTVEDVNWSLSGTGDFDGDGNIDIILRNEAADQIVAWYMDGSGNILREGLVGRGFGDNNWKIDAAADFNRDGKADLLLRNGLSGQNILWEMDGGTILAESTFGRDIPDINWHIEGARDFDNNGTIDVLLRQRSAGQALLWTMADKNTIASEALISGVPASESQLVF